MRRPLLAPLVPLYAAGAALRDFRIKRGWERVRELRWPVVSVGNLSTGGAGKTPFAIALAHLLRQREFHVDVLSRGYGRASRKPARVFPNGTTAEFGDEPLLITQATGAPVYVAPQRYDAGLLAEAEFARQHGGNEDSELAAHILDDGFQHRQLARDVDILLLSESDLHDSLLPAGNLREPLKAIRRATVVAVSADDAAVKQELHRRGWRGPIWRFHRRMEVPAVEGSVAVFCGIARPEQFFAGIESAGTRIAVKRAFRDHHPYTPADMEHLLRAAQSAGARALITTDKDLVRIGSLAEQVRKNLPLITATLRVEIEDSDVSVEWLSQRLASRSPHRAL